MAGATARPFPFPLTMGRRGGSRASPTPKRRGGAGPVGWRRGSVPNVATHLQMGTPDGGSARPVENAGALSF